VIASRQRQTKAALEQVGSERGEANRFLVEIHKKFSIPVACIVFVLVGAPLGVMARAGGVGTGVAYSLSFFVLYWVCLIGGESLADRGIVQPAVAMWTPNAVLGLMGIWLVSRMGREVQFFRYRWLLTALRLVRLLRPEAV
jgi:lipopolysaccharide export system permease protein